MSRNGEWDNCIKITGRLSRISTHDYSHLLAQYHCEKAEEALREGRYSTAEDFVNSAINADDSCVRAIIQSGRIKAIRGNHEAAIEIWKRIETIDPKYTPETVSLITESYKVLDRPRELAEFLRETAENETDPQLVVAYVDILESLDEVETAIDYLTDWIRRHPSLYCLHRLILLKLKGTVSTVPSDFELIESMIQKEIDTSRLYRCQRCGYTVKSLHWQCPSCRGWTTFEGKRGAKLVSEQ